MTFSSSVSWGKAFACLFGLFDLFHLSISRSSSSACQFPELFSHFSHLYLGPSHLRYKEQKQRRRNWGNTDFGTWDILLSEVASPSVDELMWSLLVMGTFWQHLKATSDEKGVGYLEFVEPVIKVKKWHSGRLWILDSHYHNTFLMIIIPVVKLNTSSVFCNTKKKKKKNR